jgi:purine catabolism regulator
MVVTLREVLSLPVVRDAEAEVVAAAGELGRAVRWVHVTELPDIAHLLKGGELLLTTGLGLRAGSGQGRRFIRQLAEAGVSGVVFELGPALPEVPPAMRVDAEQLGLPVIVLHRETPFVEVTEQVHRAIISEQYEILRRVEEAGRTLTGMLLDGAETEQVLARLAREVGNPVVLENDAHQLVGFADPIGRPITTLLSSWEAHSRANHREQHRGSVQRTTGSPSCAWVRIRLRHDDWGRVHVLETESEVDELGRLVLDRAAMAIGLSMLSHADAENVADRAANAVIADLLSGRIAAPEEVIQRSRSLGSELAGKHLVVLAVEGHQEEEHDRNRHLAGRPASDELRQRARLQMRTELRASIRAHNCEGLLAVQGGQVLAIVAISTHASPAVVGDIAEDLQERLRRRMPGVRLSVGASPPVESEDLVRAFEQARLAVRFGAGDGSRVLHQFGDLGTYPLLVRLARGPELAAFVESELGAVLEHDAARSAPLLPTLRAFLNSSGRKADTLRELHIQRRTLYARLERLEALLGRSLDDHETRTRLDLALQGLDVLGRTGHALGL